MSRYLGSTPRRSLLAGAAGTRFYGMARRDMPGRVLLSSTGTRFTFGA